MRVAGSGVGSVKKYTDLAVATSGLYNNGLGFVRQGDSGSFGSMQERRDMVAAASDL